MLSDRFPRVRELASRGTPGNRDVRQVAGVVSKALHRIPGVDRLPGRVVSRPLQAQQLMQLSRPSRFYEVLGHMLQPIAAVQVDERLVVQAGRAWPMPPQASRYRPARR